MTFYIKNFTRNLYQLPKQYLRDLTKIGNMGELYKYDYINFI